MSDARGVVRFSGVTKKYGETVAVRDVSFVIEAGTLVTLLGPSGCGKTTTLRMIAGLELPSGGAIHIGGTDVTRLQAHERNVAMVFQSYALFPHLTVLENVCFGLNLAGHSKSEAEGKAREGLKTVGLVGMETRWPNELSGGQQQRVALARALVLEPQVLLFDEPLSNLDARLRRQMREEIRELQQRAKITAVYVTHAQDEALSVSDKIIVMDKSVVVQEGTPRELYEAPKTLFVANFMGESNVLAGTLERIDGALGTVKLGEATVSLPHRGAGVGPVQVAVRPHAVALHKSGEGLSGKVERIVYLGDHLELTVSSALGSLFVTAPELDEPLARGDAVKVTFSSSSGGMAVLTG
jgi:iron(III) transport system ATP-binding protein